MKAYLFYFALAISPTFLAVPTAAAPRPRTTIEDAMEVIDEMAALREKGVAPALLRDADAVVIAPDVIKGGFVVAARHGHGVLLLRDKDGVWGNPIFVTITGGSLGFQVGVQATDLFLVIRNRKSLDRIFSGGGKVTLGADASIAAGPLGRQASAATDAQLRAEILSYSRSRGIFAGVALEGDGLSINAEANERFYGKRDITVTEILTGKAVVPESALQLREKLSRWPVAKSETGPSLPTRLGEPRTP